MKILVIDDEQEIREFLQLSLERECYSVDVAADGVTGLELARINDYDLVILDVVLPGLDGKTVCQKIRLKKDVPIIMLTVKTEVSNKIELLDLGADDYVTKPFSFGELLARIRAIVKRPAKIQGTVLQVGSIVLDQNCHRVTRNKKEIMLTRKEFCLLEYMMRNKGKILSRNMLLEHVWDINTDPLSNTVEAHVTNLRKKLFYPGAKEIIHNIKGVGYKFE